MSELPPQEQSFEDVSAMKVEDLVALMAEKGVDAPEYQEVFQKWAQAQENMIDAIANDGTAESVREHRTAQFTYELDKVLLLLKSGDAEGALEALETTATAIEQEKLLDFSNRIHDLYDLVLAAIEK